MPVSYIDKLGLLAESQPLNYEQVQEIKKKKPKKKGVRRSCLFCNKKIKTKPEVRVIRARISGNISDVAVDCRVCDLCKERYKLKD